MEQMKAEIKRLQAENKQLLKEKCEVGDRELSRILSDKLTANGIKTESDGCNFKLEIGGGGYITDSNMSQGRKIYLPKIGKLEGPMIGMRKTPTKQQVDVIQKVENIVKSDETLNKKIGHIETVPYQMYAPEYKQLEENGYKYYLHEDPQFTYLGKVLRQMGGRRTRKRTRRKSRKKSKKRSRRHKTRRKSRKSRKRTRKKSRRKRRTRRRSRKR